jgi:hypothetical protein
MTITLLLLRLVASRGEVRNWTNYGTFYPRRRWCPGGTVGRACIDRTHEYSLGVFPGIRVYNSSQ